MSVRVSLLLAAALLFPLQIALADIDPSATSVSISPSSIGNDFSTVVTWAVDPSASGAQIYFDCPVGITIISDTAATIPCKSRVALGVGQSGNSGFTITNVNGATQTIKVTVYAVDQSGVVNEASAKSASFSVGTVAQPIVDFSTNTWGVASNNPITLSWIGIDVPGTMLRFDCVPNVKLYVGDPSTSEPLPCITNASTKMQLKTGSFTVTAVNEGSSNATVTAHIVPAITDGTYDLLHQSTLSFTVLAPVNAQPKPTNPVLTFESSGAVVPTDSAITLSWTAKNTTGQFIKFDCNTFLTVTLENSSSTLPCDMPSLPELPTSGSRTIFVHNITITPQGLVAKLVPRVGDTDYGVDAHALYFTVNPRQSGLPPQQLMSAPKPQGSVVPSVTPPPPPVKSATTSRSLLSAPRQTESAAPSSPLSRLMELSIAYANAESGSVLGASTSTVAASTAARVKFAVPLARGFRGDAVSDLQTFLALNPDIYPEARVTGYFGPATEAAVMRFQVKYDLAKEGDAGYGYVGPATRAKLNSLDTP